MELLGYADEVWGKRPPTDLDAWYGKNAPELVGLTTIGQQRAVASAETYTSEVLSQQGTPIDPIATPRTDGLVGVASDGRTLDGLYYGAIAQVGQQTEAKGAQKAWADGLSKLHVYMQTQLSDASRAATGLSMVARPRTGYVRMINPPACSRCVILAGRFYRYNAAFRRHPGCDCSQIISLEDNAEDIRTDPVKYFNSLTADEQNKAFTRAGAEAIRLGADINQVVNVRRGAAGLDSAVGSTGRLQRQNVYGQDLFTSTEGVTKRGVAGRVIRNRGRDPRTTPRLMPEAVLEIAESREDAIRLLAHNGFMVQRAGVPLSGPGSRTGLVPNVGTRTAALRDAPRPAPVSTDMYGTETSAATYWQVRDQVDAYPEHLREMLGNAGVTVQVASRLTETAGGAKWAGVRYADGRTFDDMSAVYDEQAKAVLLNGNLTSGSTNTVFHEMSHAVDDTALRDKPLDVEWQEPGQDAVTHRIDLVSDDPYLQWAHDRVFDAGLADPYYRVGSMDNKASGRSEWFAESVAAVVNNDPVALLRVSAFDSQAIDMLRWSLSRILDI